MENSNAMGKCFYICQCTEMHEYTFIHKLCSTRINILLHFIADQSFCISVVTLCTLYFLLHAITKGVVWCGDVCEFYRRKAYEIDITLDDSCFVGLLQAANIRSHLKQSFQMLNLAYWIILLFSFDKASLAALADFKVITVWHYRGTGVAHYER